MKVLVTISDMSRVAVILDLKTGKQVAIPSNDVFCDRSVIGRPICRPFGITWFNERLYIANNLQLLVFDSAFGYLHTAASSLQVNVHQLVAHDGVIWAASPWTNSLIGISTINHSRDVEFDVFRQSLRPYNSFRQPESNDLHHINSILWAAGSMFVVAHNFGRSFILCFDQHTFKLQSMHNDVGDSVHCLAYWQDDLYFISTLTSEIRSLKGYRLALSRSGFARGLAMTDKHFVVAISESQDLRSDRTAGDASILVFDIASKKLECEFKLIGTGSVNELRLLDVFDFAHNVVPFESETDQHF